MSCLRLNMLSGLAVRAQSGHNGGRYSTGQIVPNALLRMHSVSLSTRREMKGQEVVCYFDGELIAPEVVEVLEVKG